MKIFVTGGTGFIGSRLVESLLADGHAVCFSGRSRLDRNESGAEYRRGDLVDENFALEVSRGVDAIIHCAGLAGTWGPFADYYRANVLATRHLMEGARANGVRRVVNISSPSIYFDFKDQLNLKEDQLPSRFSNAYAQTKYEAEVLLQTYHSRDLQTVSLRPRSVIGRGDQNVLPRLIRLQKSGSLVQVGKGENVVDITTIGNLIDAVKLSLEAPEEAMGETYNVTNGQPVRFWSFVDEVLAAAGLPTDRRRVPYIPVMAVARANELVNQLLKTKKEPALLPISVGVISFSMTLDISKARQKLGYSPRFSTRDGIREFIEGASAKA